MSSTRSQSSSPRSRFADEVPVDSGSFRRRRRRRVRRQLFGTRRDPVEQGDQTTRDNNNDRRIRSPVMSPTLSGSYLQPPTSSNATAAPLGSSRRGRSIDGGGVEANRIEANRIETNRVDEETAMLRAIIDSVVDNEVASATGIGNLIDDDPSLTLPSLMLPSLTLSENSPLLGSSSPVGFGASEVAADERTGLADGTRVAGGTRAIGRSTRVRFSYGDLRPHLRSSRNGQLLHSQPPAPPPPPQLIRFRVIAGEVGEEEEEEEEVEEEEDEAGEEVAGDVEAASRPNRQRARSRASVDFTRDERSWTSRGRDSGSAVLSNSSAGATTARTSNFAGAGTRETAAEPQSSHSGLSIMTPLYQRRYLRNQLLRSGNSVGTGQQVVAAAPLVSSALRPLVVRERLPTDVRPAVGDPAVAELEELGSAGEQLVNFSAPPSVRIVRDEQSGTYATIVNETTIGARHFEPRMALWRDDVNAGRNENQRGGGQPSGQSGGGSGRRRRQRRSRLPRAPHHATRVLRGPVGSVTGTTIVTTATTATTTTTTRTHSRQLPRAQAQLEALQLQPLPSAPTPPPLVRAGLLAARHFLASRFGPTTRPTRAVANTVNYESPSRSVTRFPPDGETDDVGYVGQQQQHQQHQQQREQDSVNADAADDDDDDPFFNPYYVTRGDGTRDTVANPDDGGGVVDANADVESWNDESEDDESGDDDSEDEDDGDDDDGEEDDSVHHDYEVTDEEAVVSGNDTGVSSSNDSFHGHRSTGANELAPDDGEAEDEDVGWIDTSSSTTYVRSGARPSSSARPSLARATESPRETGSVTATSTTVARPVLPPRSLRHRDPPLNAAVKRPLPPSHNSAEHTVESLSKRTKVWAHHDRVGGVQVRLDDHQHRQLSERFCRMADSPDYTRLPDHCPPLYFLRLEADLLNAGNVAREDADEVIAAAATTTDNTASDVELSDRCNDGQRNDGGPSAADVVAPVSSALDFARELLLHEREYDADAKVAVESKADFESLVETTDDDGAVDRAFLRLETQLAAAERRLRRRRSLVRALRDEYHRADESIDRVAVLRVALRAQERSVGLHGDVSHSGGDPLRRLAESCMQCDVCLDRKRAIDFCFNEHCSHRQCRDCLVEKYRVLVCAPPGLIPNHEPLLVTPCHICRAPNRSYFGLMRTGGLFRFERIFCFGQLW